MGWWPTIIRQAPFAPKEAGTHTPHSFLLADAKPFGPRGPAGGRTLVLPWQLFSVVCAACDALMLAVVVVLFQMGGRRMPRLRHLSVTSRYALFFLFGTARLAMVDYLFAGLASFYYAVAYALFTVVLVWAGVGLLTGWGPWALLRPLTCWRSSWQAQGKA